MKNIKSHLEVSLYHSEISLEEAIFHHFSTNITP